MQLYVHIPFCKSKCQYCDFNSYACVDDAVINSYFSAIIKEIIFASKNFSKSKINSIYIGGGTPSLVDEKFILRISDAIYNYFDCDVSEFTIECNPESVSEEKLECYKKAKINRISLGVQSLDNNNLRSVGRIHTAEQALNCLEIINKYFNNVSADLIIGLPYDTNSIIINEIQVLSKFIKHLSMYELSVEKGTPLFERVQNDTVCLPSDDEVVDMFSTALKIAKQCGFNRYEVSNFAQQGYEAIHNSGYWTREEYIGLGAGAHSFIKTKDGKEKLNNQIRFSSPKNINAYIGGINCVNAFDKVPRMDYEILKNEDILYEKIMLGLRMTNGVEAELIKNKITSDISEYFIEKGGRISLTDNGFQILNTLLCRIL